MLFLYMIFIIIPIVYGFDVSNKIFTIKKLFIPRDTNDLFNRIVRHQIDEIIISPDYKEVISIDKVFPDDNFVSSGDYQSYDLIAPIDHYHITNINQIVIKKIIDDSLQNGITTTFTRNPPSFDALNFVDDVIFPGFLLVIAIQIFTSFIPRSPFPALFKNYSKKSPKDLMKKQNITLNSWKGSKEVFDECYEVISFLNDGKEYHNMGSKIPKGILLTGPPGTGKTLLAKAIASETKANFISVSGSEFIQMYVGMGALRVRTLFEDARKKAPSIIFIDEIDAIGRARSSGGNPLSGGEHDQTLNQLLTEMDGFQDNENIIVMGATNMKDTLDPALLRPGRFDRIITVPLPDEESIAEILAFYLSKVKSSSEISVKKFAKKLEGYSGSEISNVVNEASIYAVRRKGEEVIEIDLEAALEKLTVGIVKKNDKRSYEEKYRVAIHELGHGVIVWIFKDYFILNKISIQSTYSGVEGTTSFESIKKSLATADFITKRIMISLGGRVAEEIFYGQNGVSIGAQKDYEQASNMAKQMVEKFGMSDFTKAYARPILNSYSKDISEEMHTQIDLSIIAILEDSYLKTKEILLNYQNQIDFIARILIVVRSISGEKFSSLI